MRELLLHKGDCSFCTKLTDVSLFKGRETGRCVLSGDRNKEQSACEAYCADTGEFPEGKLNEDFHVLVRMLPEIEGIVSVPERVYNVFYKSGSNTRTGSEANFSRVYGDNVDNADMVTELVREYYPELEKTALRFGLYQRLDYMLHIPIGGMKKENRQYVEIVRYLKKNRAEICRNRELAKKEKLYLLLFSMMPATIRKVHRFVRSRR